MLRRIKRKLMYSYAGIAAAGIFIFAVITLIFLITAKRSPLPRDILIIYIFISSAVTVFLITSNISLLRHEGMRPKNLTGTFLGLAWIAGDIICLVSEKIITQIPFAVTFIHLFACYADLLISGMFLAAYIAAKHRPGYDKDFLVILGCSISKNGGLLPLLKGRTNRAIRFAWDQEIAVGKPARFIPTGGQGADEVISEGSAMEFYLLSHGAEDYEIFAEKASANTYENMLFSKKIIDDVLPGAKICFVTTNYHVLRSGMLARKAGIDAEGLASSTKWYFWPNGFAREVFAMLTMFPVQHIAAAAVCVIAALL